MPKQLVEMLVMKSKWSHSMPEYLNQPVELEIGLQMEHTGCGLITDNTTKPNHSVGIGKESRKISFIIIIMITISIRIYWSLWLFITRYCKINLIWKILIKRAIGQSGTVLSTDGYKIQTFLQKMQVDKSSAI